MGKIINLPTRPPERAQLEAVSAQLARVLQVIADELIDQGDEINDASSVGEFAAVVHSTAEILAEASQHWSVLSATIRNHWRL